MEWGKREEERGMECVCGKKGKIKAESEREMRKSWPRTERLRTCYRASSKLCPYKVMRVCVEKDASISDFSFTGPLNQTSHLSLRLQLIIIFMINNRLIITSIQCQKTVRSFQSPRLKVFFLSEQVSKPPRYLILRGWNQRRFGIFVW